MEEAAAAGIHETETTTRWWITANDLDYLLLVMIYALLRLAWQRSVLVFGIIKDVNSAELAKTVVPILQSAGKIKLARQLPLFNSDKMLLQTASVINGAETKAPWRSIEFDACFRTIAPIIVDAQRALAAVTAATTGTITTTNSTIGTSPSTAAAVVNVTGAFKNVISSERVFIKSYIQLWCSDTDPAVRSHVFSYDRPCYSEFDCYDPKKKKKDTAAPTCPAAAEVVLQHIGEKVMEEIVPVVHFEYDSPISHLIMDILCSMSSEVIPECLGYNYPLFLADKKAKSILEGSKMAYLSTITFEMANSEFDQQVLFAARFREYRSAIESKRRKSITT